MYSVLWLAKMLTLLTYYHSMCTKAHLFGHMFNQQKNRMCGFFMNERIWQCYGCDMLALSYNILINEWHCLSQIFIITFHSSKIFAHFVGANTNIHKHTLECMEKMVVFHLVWLWAFAHNLLHVITAAIWNSNMVERPAHHTTRQHHSTPEWKGIIWIQVGNN